MSLFGDTFVSPLTRFSTTITVILRYVSTITGCALTGGLQRG